MSGPGTYEIDSQSLAERSLNSHNKSVKLGKGTFLTSLADDRSAKSLTEDGDPTLYSDYHLKKASLGTETSVNRRVREGKIAFNSNSARCGSSDYGEQTPMRGPGTYDHSHLYRTGVVKSAARAGTTAFTNKAPLLGYIRKNDTPGAGAYNPQRLDGGMGFSYSKLGSCSFAGNSCLLYTSPSPRDS